MWGIQGDAIPPGGQLRPFIGWGAWGGWWRGWWTEFGREGREGGKLLVTGRYRVRNLLSPSNPPATVLWAEPSLLSSEPAQPRRKPFVWGAQQQKMEGGGGVGREKEDTESGPIRRGGGWLGPRDSWILVWGNRGTRGSEGGVHVRGRSKPRAGLRLSCFPTNLWTSPAFSFLSLALRERAVRLHRRPSLGGVGLNLTARGRNGLNPAASQDFCRFLPVAQRLQPNVRFPLPLTIKRTLLQNAWIRWHTMRGWGPHSFHEYSSNAWPCS